MSNPVVVTRFAPSPTGRLHLGNARTAIFNYLLARRAGGCFLLRLEDTDARRGDPSSEAAILSDLGWLGLRWEEDAILRQSERSGVYKRFFDLLEQKDLAYPCFCTDEELRAARRAQAAAGKPPRYPGTCSRLSPEQRRERFERGQPASLRFRVNADRSVTWQDLVRGDQVFHGGDLGDFVIRRSDGTAAFLFANAVDDALSGVTTVLRGEDHVANTPRQLLLLEALDLDVPRFGHVPLVVGRDGSPLSKRGGAASLGELRERGWLPLAVMNYLARLGHHLEDERLLDIEGLAAAFDASHLGRSPAHFDEAQLRHWQRLAVSSLEPRDFRAWAEEAMAAVPGARAEAFIEGVRPNCLFPADAAHWAKVLFGDMPEPGADARETLLEAGPEFLEAAAEVLRKGGFDAAGLKSATGRKGRALFMPLRAGLTGECHGPELAAVVELLGAERAAARLERGALALEGKQ